MSLSVLLNWLVTVYFIGEVEQKRRAQSFLSGQEPKAGKLVRSEKSPEWIFHSFLRPGEILLVAYWEDQNNCPYSRACKYVAQGSKVAQQFFIYKIFIYFISITLDSIT